MANVYDLACHVIVKLPQAAETVANVYELLLHTVFKHMFLCVHFLAYIPLKHIFFSYIGLRHCLVEPVLGRKIR